MKIILIAGGSGLIGKKLNHVLSSKGYKVHTLTRKARHRGQIYWNPSQQTIEGKHLEKVNIIINLAGENIGEKKWTVERKNALRDSRLKSTQFLHSLVSNFPNLEYYVSASGINCYERDDKVHVETDPYGKDFLSKLVKEWEASSDLFENNCKVAKLRISMVLSKRGGALDKMLLPVKLGLGSPIGTGTQMMPWIHIDDLCNLFVYAIENELTGTFNASANCVSNHDFMKSLTKALNRPFFMPNVPAFLLKLILGEMSTLVLDSTNASNEKIKNTGFVFQHESIEPTLNSIFKR